MPPRDRLQTLAVALALAPGLVGLPAAAAGPDQAAGERKPVEERARDMRVSGEHAAAAAYLAEEAARLRDPVLFLDAAEAYKAAADASRDPAQVALAVEQAKIAADMLHFLGDDRAGGAWRPVSDSHRESLLSRVGLLLAECEALASEIESGPVEPAAPVEKKRRGRAKPGTGLLIGGGVAAAIGLGGAVLGGIGLGKGAKAQDTVEDPTVYGAEYDVWDDYGRDMNTLAYIGLPLAAVGLGAGTALIVLGMKKRRQASGSPEPTTARLRVFPGPTGISLRGSF
jgi:hypothetical protein